MDMGAYVCSGAVCRGAQLPVAADACSAGVRCVGDYDSRPSVCHADTSGSVPAAPLQSRESVVGAIIGTAAGLAMAFAAGYVADRVDRPHLKPSVNTGVVTSVGAFTVAVIAVVSCFVRM